MENAELIRIKIEHENPLEEFEHNVWHSSSRVYEFKKYIYRMYDPSNRFAKMLTAIYNNPGLSRNAYRELIGARGQCAEYFMVLSHGQLITNDRRTGYHITELGIAMLIHFGLI